MINDQRRVQNSTLISLSLHTLIFGIYLFLKATQPQSDLIITQVELIEFETPQQAMNEPAATRRPKSIKDMLKMALPKFNLPKTQESDPQEMTIDKHQPTIKFESKPLLRDKGQLDRRPTLSLKSEKLARNQTATLSRYCITATRWGPTVRASY